MCVLHTDGVVPVDIRGNRLLLVKTGCLSGNLFGIGLQCELRITDRNILAAVQIAERRRAVIVSRFVFTPVRFAREASVRM